VLKIDHVAIISPNVMSTAWQLRMAGLDSYDGGFSHVREGDALRGATAHRAVPLGNDQYIEIEQFIDSRPVAELDAGFPRYMASLRDQVTRDGPVVLAFWVVTDDFDKAAERLGGQQQHQRVKPDGSVIRSRTAPWSFEAISRGLPPFFVFDIPVEQHPARTPVRNESEPTGIAWMEVGGDPEVMKDWLGPDADLLPLRYVGGEPGVRGMGVSNADNEVIEIRAGGHMLDVRHVPADAR
jgi:Glyoxalase-like domain